MDIQLPEHEDWIEAYIKAHGRDGKLFCNQHRGIKKVRAVCLFRYDQGGLKAYQALCRKHANESRWYSMGYETHGFID